VKVASEFYNKVLEECSKLFGDGAERFLNRQIENHLSKNPDTLSYADKEELARWIRVSAGLVFPAETAEELSLTIQSFGRTT